MRIKGAVVKSQFCVARSFKELNAKRILEELAKLNDFEDEMKSDDPDRIAEGVKDKLNTVVNKLAPSKLVQKRKKDDVASKNAKIAYEKAKNLKKIAQETKDIEDERHARNALATANRVNREANNQAIKK